MLIATICITLNNWLISNIYLVQRVNNTIVFQNLQSSYMQIKIKSFLPGKHEEDSLK